MLLSPQEINKRFDLSRYNIIGNDSYDLDKDQVIAIKGTHFNLKK